MARLPGPSHLSTATLHCLVAAADAVTAFSPEVTAFDRGTLTSPSRAQGNNQLLSAAHCTGTAVHCTVYLCSFDRRRHLTYLCCAGAAAAKWHVSAGAPAGAGGNHDNVGSRTALAGPPPAGAASAVGVRWPAGGSGLWPAVCLVARGERLAGQGAEGLIDAMLLGTHEKHTRDMVWRCGTTYSVYKKHGLPWEVPIFSCL